jgi:Mlc titration factor MtfA (ptsG expression regulator)
VNTDRSGDRRFRQIAGTLTALAAVAIGAMAAGWAGAAIGLVAGVLPALTLLRALGHRARRRTAALAVPFPTTWRETLLAAYDHFERLDPAWRARFEQDIQLFLAEKRITGVGVEVDDGLRLLVAASALTLSLGWPDYEWDQLSEVLLYPDDFDRDYRFGGAERVGEAHPWGTIILSVPALLDSFEYPDDAYHVGIHEFTHLLDVRQTHFDGIPTGLDGSDAERWVAIAEKEMERMRRGRSVFDDYGAHDPVEFLAVAVEAFFEVPQRVRRRHGEIYALLARYFGQDPAAWDDARGL